MDRGLLKNEWQTPEWLLERVRKVGPIVLDPCTTRDNPTGAKYIRTKDCDPDGLQTYWWHLAGPGGLIYVNPPYGRGQVDQWAHKVCEEAQKGCLVLALMRGDTSTDWAHSMLNAASLVCFPKRIKFRGANGSPNFASTVYLFCEHDPKVRWAFFLAFCNLGPVMEISRGLL